MNKKERRDYHKYIQNQEAIIKELRDVLGWIKGNIELPVYSDKQVIEEINKVLK